VLPQTCPDAQHMLLFIHCCPAEQQVLPHTRLGSQHTPATHLPEQQLPEQRTCKKQQQKRAQGCQQTQDSMFCCDSSPTCLAYAAANGAPQVKAHLCTACYPDHTQQSTKHLQAFHKMKKFASRTVTKLQDSLHTVHWERSSNPACHCTLNDLVTQPATAV
jgi:hypothetical protein